MAILLHPAERLFCPSASSVAAKTQKPPRRNAPGAGSLPAVSLPEYLGDALHLIHAELVAQAFDGFEGGDDVRAHAGCGGRGGLGRDVERGLRRGRPLPATLLLLPGLFLRAV